MSSTTTEHLPDVSSMYVDSVSVQPVEKDWTEGYGETWDYIRVPTCPWCETVCPDDDIDVEITTAQMAAREIDADELTHDDGEEEEGGLIAVERDCCPNPDCEHFRDEVDPFEADDGPMMSYYYPLPAKSWGGRSAWTREDATKLDGLPLVIVYFDEDPSDGALALSGGGMDLSWEICEAFMRLGFLPPAKYAELPGMAGYMSAQDYALDTHRWIVAGCRRTFEVQRTWAENGLASLARLESD